PLLSLTRIDGRSREPDPRFVRLGTRPVWDVPLGRITGGPEPRSLRDGASFRPRTAVARPTAARTRGGGTRSAGTGMDPGRPPLSRRGTGSGSPSGRGRQHGALHHRPAGRIGGLNRPALRLCPAPSDRAGDHLPPRTRGTSPRTRDRQLRPGPVRVPGHRRGGSAHRDLVPGRPPAAVLRREGHARARADGVRIRLRTAGEGCGPLAGRHTPPRAGSERKRYPRGGSDPAGPDFRARRCLLGGSRPEAESIRAGRIPPPVDAATPRRFARYRPAEGEVAGRRMWAAPRAGLCLSVFVLVGDPKNPNLVVLGRPAASAAWTEIGSLEPAHLESLQDRWLLPACHLVEFETPRAGAERVVREQLGLERIELRGPEVFSESYPSRIDPESG